MRRTLPEKIVAAVEALAGDLADWCVAGRDRTLAAHEEAVLERVRQVLPLLGAMVEQATSGLDVRLAHAREACPGRGRKAGPWTAATAAAHDAVWHGGAGAASVVLPGVWPRLGRGRDDAWGGRSGAAERGAAGLGVWLGAAAPFREAAGVLSGLTGLELGTETIRRHAEAAGIALREAEEAAAEQVARTRELAAALDPAPGFPVVQTDGAMVRHRDGWHEMTLGLVAGREEGELRAPSYVAAREPAAAFGARLASEAARRGALEVARREDGPTGRGLAVLRELGLYGDGAAWIWHLGDERFDARIEVADPYHADQHLHAAARALFGDTPAAAE